MAKENVLRNYKDSVFRMLYRDKRELLQLYNALNGTNYQDPDGLQVLMVNVNFGQNEELMQKCRTLRDYSLYVHRVRTHAKHMPVEDAVRQAVDECIHENILSDFLRTQKAEVIAMSIFEYDEEEELKKIRRDEYELGVEAGIEQERKKQLITQKEENVRRLIQKICKKLSKGKTVEQIADELEEEPALISRLCAIAAVHAPACDCDQIAAGLGISEALETTPSPET